MSLLKTKFVWVFHLLLLITFSTADVTVQLNVNRPLNDVSEKFISFAVRPEDLYKALDGPNRKAVTRMASLLGDSYIKFVGDYNFATNGVTKLPTKIIWKGFNRWTRAMNWTMIIPVPYTPDSWDAMNALKILNSSYMVGITDCIWQLGTDFGSSRAQDYVSELKTFKLIVDSFKAYVTDWKTIGADISAGSSAEETRRYVEMSKDLNAAFGWTQSTELMPLNSMSSYIYENDAALRVLHNKKVPVWFNLPQKSKTVRSNSEEVSNALHWAQIMGETASSGFDVIFKKLNTVDLEKPNFSFYVTALFKKVMGSRVFPARPLHVFTRNNKLYTHCANAVSGGIAFMVVNTEDTAMQISVRSINTYTGTKVWQYTLNFKNGYAYLNNEKLTLNSTLTPQTKVMPTDKPIQLSTPPASVSFWVLPNADLEHCQYTEIDASEVTKETKDEKILEKRYSSSDKLLRKLIQETSLTNHLLAKANNRRRRFILENSKNEFKGLGKLFEPFDEKFVEKRATAERSPLRRPAALEWLQNLVSHPILDELPLLKRGTRSIDQFKAIFAKNKNGKKLPFTKKIIEIKKPEKKIKPIFDEQEEFDEEEFFKKMGAQTEPSYVRLPEGDIHLKHIANADGDEYEEDDRKRLHTKKLPKIVSKSQEAVNEMKPLRLLPTQFYESLPAKSPKIPGNYKMPFGNTLNTLLFPEPFTKKATSNIRNILGKNFRDEESVESLKDESAMIGNKKYEKRAQISKGFVQTQKELGKEFLGDSKNSDESKENTEIDQAETEDPLGFDNLLQAKRRKFADYFNDNIENYFRENEETAITERPTGFDAEHSVAETEIPWWDLSNLRHKRALKRQIPDDAWRSNMITKDDELLIPLGETFAPEHLSPYEHQLKDSEKKAEEQENAHNSSLMASVKRKVNKLVDIVTRHVSEWYNTFTKHIEATSSTITTSSSDEQTTIRIDYR